MGDLRKALEELNTSETNMAFRSGFYTAKREALDAIDAHPPEPAEGTGLREVLEAVQVYRGYEWSENGSQFERELAARINQALTAPAPDGGLVAGIDLAQTWTHSADPVTQRFGRYMLEALRAQPPKETEQQRQLREKGIPYLQRKLRGEP